MVAAESKDRRSSSLSTRKEGVRHYVISSSSSSSRSRSRSRSSSYSSGRSRSPKYRRHRHKHSHKRYHSGSRHRSRSHSRSHSHGQSASASAQSSEKKFFGTNSTDPKMVASRLFIGCLPYDISKDDIRAIYGKYGNIIGKNQLLLDVIASSSFCSTINKNFNFLKHLLNFAVCSFCPTAKISYIIICPIAIA